MELETERLSLIPLSPRQMRLWVEYPAQLEAELSARYQAEPLEGGFLEIVKGQADAAEDDPEHYLWHSFWFVIRKCDRVIVGSAVFKGVPDQNGAVEIGYGLGEAFEKHGYMTEAVKAVCAWALAQAAVTAVLAETEPDGRASQKILERCGFSRFRRGEAPWWKREKTS